MSSRRKRAPPVRVDEEAKKRLSWNMLEDRRGECEDAETDRRVPGCSPEPSAVTAERGREGDEVLPPGTSSDATAASSSSSSPPPACPSLSVHPASALALDVWRSLLGEFSLKPGAPVLPDSDCEQRAFTLRGIGQRVCLSYSQLGEEKKEGNEEAVCTVEYSLSGVQLEDLDWLQKRGWLQLCHQTKGGVIKVGIYLLEAGLSKPAFVSEGTASLKKKAFQLMQKLMEYFYDFIIPEVVETKEEDWDTDLERQNVEELYDYVRHHHQLQDQGPTQDVQHAALIPVLRPYQSQAVNWMLGRERDGLASPKEPSLHFLWREVVTLCGKKLFYNPFTGCLTREFPPAGVQWPGGILADEMGLGKTVEVLALILSHSRQGLESETLALPPGKSVNYFVPPPPLKMETTSEGPPKVRRSHPPLRTMLLTAIKQTMAATACKAASPRSVFSYIRTTYGYNPKNRGVIRRPLDKLIEEDMVCRVKGSLRLGKRYKDKEPQRRPLKVIRPVFDKPVENKEATPTRTSLQRSAKEKVDYSSPPTSPEEYPERKRSEDTAPGPEVADQSDADEELASHVSRGETQTLSPPPPTNSVPLNTADYHFECFCGELGVADYKARVQCMSCQLWQHAGCVNYEEASRETTPFYCPHCLVAMAPIPTGATLIISPSSICNQWVEEINRHISSTSLRVLVYQGVKRQGFLQPRQLAQQDVVLTTYDVLCSELSYVDIPHSSSSKGARRFRYQKRYMAVPSPLVAVEWWRVCLDEAQMVESTTAKPAEMALRLSSINRWCVSGTPVQRGLEDLYGLVLFLGVDPYWVKHWWDRLLYRPYRRGNTEPLYSVIAPLLWRSAKKDVIDQIQIPPQTEEVHWLSFSPVEGHFYHRQRDVCSRNALMQLRKISDWSLKLGSLDRRTVTSVLGPLLRLRQACCHPQAVRGEFLPLQKSTMTMEQLLKSLQRKCRVECEEAHRQLVCALNGLAGIHIIRGRLKTDSLQRLHATHNLMELLSAKHAGIPPTLRDDRLGEEAEHLRQHYMTKYNSEVSDALQALQPVQQNIRVLKRKVNLLCPWWMEVIQMALQNSVDEELISRVHNELSNSYKQQPNKFSIADKFHDGRGLQMILCMQMEELMGSQKTVQDAVKSLEGPASKEVIEEVTVCHLRPVRLPLNNCVYCKADELFTNYESKLFSHTVKDQTAFFEEMMEEEEGLVDDHQPRPTTSRGLWALSETERTLKAVLIFAKAKRMDSKLVEEGNVFMELLENWKKEYKVLHEYWMMLRNHVSAIDELGMATERLRLRLPDEPKLKVETNRMNLLNDKAMAKSQLNKKLGQSLYLNNLEKSQDKESGAVNPEPCPICARPLGQEWAVLTCGHCFCNECIAIIVEQYSVGSRHRAIKCAICRQTTAHAEISYVVTCQEADPDQDIPVKGSHSTKVEAVVRTLKKIQLTDPGAKCLVFSTWQCVLDIIAMALLDNTMEFSQINGMQKFQENLSCFKHKENINILLLPLQTGSNGLNIIQATHVLLVEPILNPAHELQAIGRVHRIGQTKATFVHRFLIKATIEERMQAMIKTAEKSHSAAAMKHSEASVLTVADLADLFSEDVWCAWLVLGLMKVTSAAVDLEPEDTAELNETVVCTNDRMDVLIPSAFFLNKVWDLHLNDPECRGVEVGEDYVFSIKTNLSDCGTVMASDDTHIMFINTIRNNDSDIVTRNYINITFVCRYPVNYMVQQPNGENLVRVDVRTITLNTEDGNFSVSMLLYKDQAFEDRWTTVPSLTLDDDIFVKLFMIPANLMLRVERCWATPTSDPYSNTLTLLRNGQGPEAMFRIQMFKFVGSSYRDVFLHCNNCSATEDGLDRLWLRSRRSYPAREAQLTLSNIHHISEVAS
ncbi:hypothetical protein NHX12_019346 [Muraenolepis orangiensis]|uniref:SNF2 histone linker PHD RING helicase n=1 Tax=Muraenolepis orangiensis TaxID=630683 RepID=A0A9Q0IWI2_9TELE|nr:hypothetical protein NHX12_019346 [Muraenolepis orangiensis]